MHTNTSKYGGNFKDVLEKEFSLAKNVVVASGYASLDVIEAFRQNFLSIAERGGSSQLLLGMAFYEGLSQKKLDAVTSLNNELRVLSKTSGVYVTNGRRYHGKVYYFDRDDSEHVYVGSSNFSSSGTSGNIECTIPVLIESQRKQLIDFLTDLCSPFYSLTIDKVEITVPGKKNIILNKVQNQWDSIKSYDPSSIDFSTLPKFIFPLERVASMSKSNLNVYFGKGRLNTSTGKILPRPWYEIELIASNELNSSMNYPKGRFTAYTDDGFIIPMKTQGDNYKNIRSVDSLQIFGIWLKGKLERKGVLKRYQPVTLDTLREYGSSDLIFYKIKDDEYFLKF